SFTRFLYSFFDHFFLTSRHESFAARHRCQFQSTSATPGGSAIAFLCEQLRVLRGFLRAVFHRRRKMNTKGHRPVVRLVLSIVTLALLLAVSAAAQVLKGSISGTVTDPQGAVVPGATIKAINGATGATLNTTSDAAGSFHFNLIPAGEYKVEVSAT